MDTNLRKTEDRIFIAVLLWIPVSQSIFQETKHSSTKGVILLFEDTFLSRGMTMSVPLRRCLKKILNALVFRITSSDIGPVNPVSHML